jgi:co-chaperonin GroES (HSP10)
MSVVIPHKFIESVSKSVDPKQAILDFVGDLSDIEIIGDRVLIASYMRPEKTAGGIIRPDANKAEDVWQGKVGLVLKCGPDAFIDPASGDPYDQTFKPGDWALFFIGDGKALEVNKAPCRIVRDVHLFAKVKTPEKYL